MAGGNSPRGVKRCAPRSEIQERLQLHLSPVLNKIRTVFKKEGESSLQKESDDSHIIYYDAFINHPLWVGNRSVTTREWARAFLQEDYTTTALKICEAFIKHDTPVDEDLRVLIHRISQWMMSKFDPLAYIDPWSFPQFIDDMPLPSGENYAAVESVIKFFQPQSILQQIDQSWENFFNNVVLDGTLAEGINQIVDSSHPETQKYIRVFNEFMKHLASEDVGPLLQKSDIAPTNLARLAAALTRETIPWNTDFFVDAIQFAQDRVALASKEEKPEKIAGRLSKTIWRLDFATGEFLSSYPYPTVAEMCPVRLLAILRMTKHIQAVKPMLEKAKSKKEMYKIFEFNSEIPEHNRFPTAEELGKFTAELNLTAVEVIKREEARRAQKQPKNAAPSQNCVQNAPYENPNSFTQHTVTVEPQPSTSQFFQASTIPQNGPYEPQNSFPNPAMEPQPSTSQACQAATIPQNYANNCHNNQMNTWNSGNIDDDMRLINLGGNFAAHVENNEDQSFQMPEPNFIELQPPVLPPQPANIQLFPVHVQVEQVPLDAQVQQHAAQNDDPQIPAAYTDAQNQQNAPQFEDLIVIGEPEEMFTFEVGGKRCSIKTSYWNAALASLRQHHSIIKAGFTLLEKLFTSEELKNNTPSGRKNTERLDGARQELLLDTMRYIYEQRNGQPFNENDWNTTKDNWKKKVINEKSSQIRNK